MRHVNASTQHNAPIIDPVKPPEHMNADEHVVEVHSHSSSGVGVLDKATLILDCLEAGPVSLGDLVKATGLARPTAHRLAVALAHLLFNVPLAVWILEGFMSGIPREIDETAYIDGYSFPRFFLTIFLPLIKAGVGVAAFFCFMFSWVELLLARTLTSVNAKPIVATMTRTVSASGMDWATLAAAGVLTIVPGAIVIWFVRHYIAKGFAMGRV